MFLRRIPHTSFGSARIQRTEFAMHNLLKHRVTCCISLDCVDGRESRTQFGNEKCPKGSFA